MPYFDVTYERHASTSGAREALLSRKMVHYIACDAVRDGTHEDQSQHAHLPELEPLVVLFGLSHPSSLAKRSGAMGT